MSIPDRPSTVPPLPSVRPKPAPLDAKAVRAAIRSASVTLADRQATGAEKEHAGMVMKWIGHVPNAEDRRIIGAWAAGHSPRMIERATGIPADVAELRFHAAVAAIVAALATR